MGSFDVEERISNFLTRKEAKFPELSSISGRNESRTVKYPSHMRLTGQFILTH